MPFPFALAPFLTRTALLLWVAPLSLFGLALSLPIRMRRGSWRVLQGRTMAVLCQGPLADWLLRRHPVGAMHAMALGHVIIAVQGPLSSRLLMHELEHVRQAERWGPLFPLLYLGSSAWQLLRGRNVYWHNHFEVAARAAEQGLQRVPDAP